jgi:hypothetical protein
MYEKTETQTEAKMLLRNYRYNKERYYNNNKKRLF